MTKAKVKTKELFTTIVILIPNWANIPVGTKFTGTLSGRKSEGRIQKESGNIYLCQNEYNGSPCNNRLGFKFSYSINSGSLANLKSQDVQISTITLDPSFKAPPLPKVKYIGSNTVYYESDKLIKVGCTSVTKNQIEEILKYMKTLEVAPVKVVAKKK